MARRVDLPVQGEKIGLVHNATRPCDFAVAKPERFQRRVVHGVKQAILGLRLLETGFSCLIGRRLQNCLHDANAARFRIEGHAPTPGPTVSLVVGVDVKKHHCAALE